MITKKQLLAQLACLQLLFLASSCDAMLRRMHTRQRERQHERREHQRELIETLQTIQTIQGINSIDEIDGTIAEIKNKAYDDCLEELHKITNIPLSALRKEIDTDRILARNLLSKKDPHATHDPNIPASLYQILRKTYEDEGLTLDSTTVNFEKTDNPNLMARAGGAVFDKNHLLIEPELWVYDSFAKTPLSKKQRSFVYDHEKQHHLLQHNSMFLPLFKLDLHDTDRTQLVSAQEIEANIHAASKNSIQACTGANLFCTSPHAEIIDGKKHCEQLQRLCALNLRKEELLERLS
jgi:hypothetical protein